MGAEPRVWRMFRTIRGGTSNQLTIPKEFADAMELGYGSTVKLELLEDEFDPMKGKMTLLVTNMDIDRYEIDGSGRLARLERQAERRAASRTANKSKGVAT